MGMAWLAMGSRLRRREAPSWNPAITHQMTSSKAQRALLRWQSGWGCLLQKIVWTVFVRSADPPKLLTSKCWNILVFDSLAVCKHCHLEQGAWIEIERCVGCQHHQYCTSHSEAPEAEGMGRCWQHLTIFDQFPTSVWCCWQLLSCGFLKPLRLHCGHCGHRRSTTNTNASWLQPSAKPRITKGPRHGLRRWRLRWATIQEHQTHPTKFGAGVYWIYIYMNVYIYIHVQLHTHIHLHNHISYILNSFPLSLSLKYIYIYIHMSNRQNYCNTNLVLLRLGLSEVAQNLHNR